MKYFLLSPDAGGRIDPTIQKTLLDFIPGRVSNMAEADVVFVPISYMNDYVFNDALYDNKLPIVLFDFLEFGWDAGDKPNILGTGDHANFAPFAHLSSAEWIKLNIWVFHHVPALTFKRELFQRDVTDRILPVEWPCRLPIPPIQSEEQFNARPYEVFNVWGHSHPSRPRLHGKIFEAMADKGINVFSDWSHIGAKEGRTWVSIYSPHWARQLIERVMDVQGHSKISVSLPGAGIKCFRSAESPCGSIMSLHDSTVAWAYPWISGVNCILLQPEYEFHDLERATQRPDLYPIYVESQRTVAQYASNAYVRDYVVPNIERIL